MSIANELITRGWTQGRAIDDEGHVCLYGAALAAQGWTVDNTTLAFKDLAGFFPRVYEALDAVLPSSDWHNDHPWVTFDDVLRIAKQADEILDA